MSCLYKLCKEKVTCLVSVEDIYKNLPKDTHITLTDIEKMLKNLAYDGYIDMVTTEKKGKFFYCITLKEKGLAFPRERESQVRDIKRRTILMFVFATGSFVIGMILRNIFSC